MSTVSPSRMLKLPALPTVRSSSIRREPWLTSCSRPARSSPGSTPRTPQDGRTRPVRGYERGTRSGWRDRRGGEREYGRVRGEAAQARNIRIEFARREPAELDRPPQVVARVSVELVPVRDQDHVALSWDRGQGGAGGAGGGIPDPGCAVGGGGGQQGAVRGERHRVYPTLVGAQGGAGSGGPESARQGKPSASHLRNVPDPCGAVLGGGGQQGAVRGERHALHPAGVAAEGGSGGAGGGVPDPGGAVGGGGGQQGAVGGERHALLPAGVASQGGSGGAGGGVPDPGGAVGGGGGQQGAVGGERHAPNRAVVAFQGGAGGAGGGVPDPGGAVVGGGGQQGALGGEGQVRTRPVWPSRVVRA